MRTIAGIIAIAAASTYVTMAIATIPRAVNPMPVTAQNRAPHRPRNRGTKVEAATREIASGTIVSSVVNGMIHRRLFILTVNILNYVDTAELLHIDYIMTRIQYNLH